MKLVLRDIKILICIKELNEKGVYANANGLHKILCGFNDYETKGLDKLSTFSIYKSLRVRQINTSISHLCNCNLINVVMDEENEAPYYLKNSRGDAYLKEYFSHHKIELKKVENYHQINIKVIPKK